MQSALERRQEIIEYLCQVRSTNLMVLCSKFEVSRTTIYRDLAYLTSSYPIFTQQGNGGCVYIQEGYYLHKKYLSTEQQELLERLKSSVGKEDAETLESIIQKFGRR